jgi:hypothetical protein
MTARRTRKLSRRVGHAYVGSTIAIGALVLVGCSPSNGGIFPGTGAPTRGVVVSTVHALSLRLVSTPKLHFVAPGYQATGSYPEVRDGSDPLTAVNRAIKAAVARNQALDIPEPVSPIPDDEGTYRIDTQISLISSSNRVFSALLGVYVHNPGGTGGSASYLSVTLRVPSGAIVSLVDLFKAPGAALAVISSFVRADLATTYPDCRSLILSSEGLSPTPDNYQSFAMLPGGLAFGFAAGHTGSEACGPMRATVPWARIRTLLTPIGLQLVSGLRSPSP